MAQDLRCPPIFFQKGAHHEPQRHHQKIITAKVSKGITWESVAKKVGLSKEWTTAACLGQMTLDAKQAKTVGIRRWPSEHCAACSASGWFSPARATGPLTPQLTSTGPRGS